MISAEDISDYNYRREWGSTEAQHQDYDSLISISHQRWSIDFLPKSITVKSDAPRLSKNHAHPGAWRESAGGGRTGKKKTTKKVITGALVRLRGEKQKWESHTYNWGRFTDLNWCHTQGIQVQPNYRSALLPTYRAQYHDIKWSFSFYNVKLSQCNKAWKWSRDSLTFLRETIT